MNLSVTKRHNFNPSFEMDTSEKEPVNEWNDRESALTKETGGHWHTVVPEFPDIPPEIPPVVEGPVTGGMVNPWNPVPGIPSGL